MSTKLTLRLTELSEIPVIIHHCSFLKSNPSFVSHHPHPLSAQIHPSPGGIPNPTPQTPCNKAAAGDLCRYCQVRGRICRDLQRSGLSHPPWKRPLFCSCWMRMFSRRSGLGMKPISQPSFTSLPIHQSLLYFCNTAKFMATPAPKSPPFLSHTLTRAHERTPLTCRVVKGEKVKFILGSRLTRSLGFGQGLGDEVNNSLTPLVNLEVYQKFIMYYLPNITLCLFQYA